MRTVTEPDVPYEGANVGDEYIDLEIMNCAEHIYIPLGDIDAPQADWNEGNSDSGAFIKNKPTIKAGQGENSIIEGDIDNNVAGNFSHAEGYHTQATGSQSHAEGYETVASGDYGSHSEGYQTTASGNDSHTEGQFTTASGIASHAEGQQTTASGQHSHAEGAGTTASGGQSHAEGDHTIASGDKSHAEGYFTTASGSYSHAEGYSTTANHKSQHVFGEYNVLDPSATSSSDRGTYVEIVGNGTKINARSNVRTLDWQGNETLAGNLTIGGASGATLKVESGALKVSFDGGTTWLTVSAS